MRKNWKLMVLLLSVGLIGCADTKIEEAEPQDANVAEMTVNEDVVVVEENEITKEKIANILGLNCLSSSEINLFYYKDKMNDYGVQEYALTKISEKVLLTYDVYDYDLDGEEEILVISFAGDNHEKDSIVMHMLEYTSEGWCEKSSLGLNSNEWGSLVYSMDSPARIDLFINENLQGLPVVYMEYCGESYFGDGGSWDFYSYLYTNDFQLYAQPMSEYMISYAYNLGMDLLEANGDASKVDFMFEEDLDWASEIVNKVHSTGFTPDSLGLEYPMINGIEGARLLLRLEIESEMETESEKTEVCGKKTISISEYTL